MLVSKALRELRSSKNWDAVVTYADTSAGHTGQVYRAMNAEYLGLTGASDYWVDASGARVSQKATRTRSTAEMRALGLEKKRSEGKHKYVWWLTNKTTAQEGQ
jgi:hypothetical protein